MSLTPKQEHFAQLIAKGVNGTEAARTAGYSEKRAAVTASEMLRDGKVAVRVAELKAKVTERVTERVAEQIGVDKLWVVAQLVENVQMAKQAIPVMTSEGIETGEYEQNLTAANKALELIGKELGMFVERKEIRTGQLEIPDEQLDAALAAIDAILVARGERDSSRSRGEEGAQPAAGLSPVQQAG